jgi:hypothetical protein
MSWVHEGRPRFDPWVEPEIVAENMTNEGLRVAAHGKSGPPFLLRRPDVSFVGDHK